MRVLWLAPKWTFPATDGAKVATDKLVGNFAACGAEVDFACLGPPGEDVNLEEPKLRWNVRRAYYCRRNVPRGLPRKLGRYYLSRFGRPEEPMTMNSFGDAKSASFVQNLASSRKYDWIVLDGLHLAACLRDGRGFKDLNGAKLLYRAHNIEQNLWSREAAGRFGALGRSFIARQKTLIGNFEKAVLERADLVAPISEEDHQWIKRRFPGKRTALTRLGMDFRSPLPFPVRQGPDTVARGGPVELLFLGRLDWGPNRDGLKWFLKKVWPRVDHGRFHLRVAGSGDSSWLKSLLPAKGATFHGFVDDIDELYRRCHAAVVPVFYGSGTRIKVVESYAKGRAVITTELGAQGSGLSAGNDYLQVQGPRSWLEAIERFDPAHFQEMAANGAARLSRSFDEKGIAYGLFKSMS